MKALLHHILTKRAQASFTNVTPRMPRASARLPGKWNEQIKLPTQGELNTQRMLSAASATPATTAATAPAIPPAAPPATAAVAPAPASTYQF